MLANVDSLCLISQTVRKYYSLQNLGVLILQRNGCIPYIKHEIGCKLGTILKCLKKKSRKSLIYRTLSKALQDGLEPTTP